ncbi:hypothetical protein [uncultured Mediterranean phage uvMED]|nr:hypothetical protein [uncultured Mediterranean phage uvMED]
MGDKQEYNKKKFLKACESARIRTEREKHNKMKSQKNKSEKC